MSGKTGKVLFTDYSSKMSNKSKRLPLVIIYRVELIEIGKDTILKNLSKYLFDGKVLVVKWKYEKHRQWFSHGIVTVASLRETLGEQWEDFVKGKREFETIKY